MPTWKELKRFCEAKYKNLFSKSLRKQVFILVGVRGLEPPASWSQTKRAANCATPRKENLACAKPYGDGGSFSYTYTFLN